MALEDASTTKKGIVQLSSATNSTSETLAATPKAVKAANDNANGRVPSNRKVNGKALTADITLTPKDIGTLNSITMSFSGGAGWFKLATVTMPQASSIVYIALIGGAGYNVGSPHQAGISELVLRAGNGNPKGITGALWKRTAVGLANFAWINTSGDTYDIYVEIGNYATSVNIHWDCTANASVSIYTSPTYSASKPSSVTDGVVYTMYSTHQKPTPLDIGALPTTGGTVSGPLSVTGGITGTLNGNASTATKLQTARSIGGVGFDGSANINLPGVNTTGNQNTTGNAATATKLQTARTIGGVSFDGTANINLPGVNTTGNQNTTGNAATATKLQTARTINGVSFDGSANIALSPANIGCPASPTGWLVTGDNGASITTEQLVTLLRDNGAFSVKAWIARCAWAYANSASIPDSETGCGIIPLAGAVIEVFNKGSSSNNYTIRITTATTTGVSGALTNAEFVYVFNGTTYSPGWRRAYNTKNKPTAADVGALPLTGGTLSGGLTSSGEIISKSANGLRIAYGNYGFFIRNDGSNTYFMLTASGDTLGSWNGLRPIIINNTSGAVTIGNGLNVTGGINGSLNGNAATATKLQTARTIGGVSFDGSANINLPGVNIAGNQNTTGNAATATKLQTARTINGVSFDGSKNIELTPRSIGTINSATMSFSGGAGWFKLATVTMPQASSVVYISLIGGAGFNVGSPQQAGISELVLRAGNGNPKGITGALWRRTSVGFTNFAWVNTSGDTYDIYVEIGNYATGVNIQWDYTSNASVTIHTSPTYTANKPTGLTDGTVYVIYSSHIKPTAADVGALSLSGGQLNGALGIGTSSALGGNSIVLGDNDTGFKQNGDGILDVYANSAHVFRFVNGTLQSLKPLSVTGDITSSAWVYANRFSINSGSGAWIDMRNQNVIFGRNAVSTSSAQALLRQDHADRKFFLGGLGNSQFGFYMINNSRTANGTDANAYLQNDGTWVCGGNGSFNDVYIRSDRRSKRNIRKIDRALDKLEQIEGVLYEIQVCGRYEQSGGLIAQDVQNVQPELVTVDHNDQSGEPRLRLNYNGVIGMLVEAVKELREEVRELKAKM
ncbi:tail fiber protein [Shigella sonnei]|nr:tail fiber protein [Shigella sonnei]